MSKKIKILSGWSAPGGSTVAFINLCNLFNERGYDCTFYGPHDWHTRQCKSGYLDECPVNEKDENIIVHYLKFPSRPEESNRVILSCHEKNVFPIKDVPKFWDEVVYVSNTQMFWQGVGGKVIPNVVSDLHPKREFMIGVAGIIGSIDPNKQTHLSIERAVKDGFETINLFGQVTDEAYYNEKVKPLVEKHGVNMIGHVDNKQAMYDSLSKVYHSSASETFNFIKAECEKTNTPYDGLESAESGAEIWTNTQVLNAWEDILFGK